MRNIILNLSYRYKTTQTTLLPIIAKRVNQAANSDPSGGELCSQMINKSSNGRSNVQELGDIYRCWYEDHEKGTTVIKITIFVFYLAIVPNIIVPECQGLTLITFISFE